MVVRIGVVDLLSMSPDSMTRRVFLDAVAGATAQLDPTGVPNENRFETTVFGIDPRESADLADWAGMAEMDALIISGSEPSAAPIAAEPCTAVVARLLAECAEATSLLFSCQSAHAALHLLHGVDRHRLPRRQHGVFAHTVYPDLGSDADDITPIGLAGNGIERLTAGLTGSVPVPHSRWNVMTSADLRAAAVPILLDSEAAQWQLACSPDGLRHVFLQGHPEYFHDTMAREYRRDLRRWLANLALPFPDVPLGYFPDEVYAELLDHAELVRAQRDPALLENFPLPMDGTGVARDWSAHSRLFFANWLRSIEEARAERELLSA
ncbi:homoserine O-acetyltransferase/O-succinyltransferase family protein [Nocardia sp. NPDC055321]